MPKNKENEEPPQKKGNSELINFFKKKFFKFFLSQKKDDKKKSLTKEIAEFIDKNQSDLFEKNQVLDFEKNQTNALEMMKDLILFYEIILDEIKIPRNKIISISEEEILKIFDVFKKNRASNIIIYNQNLDNISGFINIKDLLLFKILFQNSEKDENFEKTQIQELKNLIQKPLFVPPTMKASNLLFQMKKENIQIAILIDEYGGTDGIITLNDIISEIIGEISEKNQEGIFFYQSDESFEVDPLISIDFLEKKIGEISFYDFNNIETLNGLIISIYNKIPEVNTEISLNQNFICKILQIDDRGIKKVLIKSTSTHSNN
jgi:magnesium and cobalt transporter